jgi:hypothetical protein
MGVIQPKRGVIHPSTTSKLSWRLRDPDVRVAVASEGETRDEALGNAKEAIEAYLEVKAEQLKQRTRGEKVVVILEAPSPLVA